MARFGIWEGEMWLFGLGAAKYAKDQKVAVLLIDMQPSFLKDIHEQKRKNVISAQKRVVELCGELDIPLFVLEMEGEGDTTDELWFLAARAVRHLSRIQKQWNDGFDGTPLLKRLKERGVTTLLLMGLHTSLCVQETAESAIEHGFTVVTATNLMADLKREWPHFSFKGALTTGLWFLINTKLLSARADIRRVLTGKTSK